MGIFNPGGSGVSGLVPLQEETASNSAVLDLASFISASYDVYVFELINVRAATSAADLWMRAGTGSPPTYDTSNHEWDSWASNQTAGTLADGSSGAGVLVLGTSLANTSTKGLSGRVTLYDPSSTTLHKQFTLQTHYHQSSGNTSQRTGGGQYLSTTAVTALRFFMSAGNIAGGTIRVYGLAPP